MLSQAIHNIYILTYTYMYTQIYFNPDDMHTYTYTHIHFHQDNT